MKLIREHNRLKLYLLENGDNVKAIGGFSSKLSVGRSFLPSLGYHVLTPKGMYILTIDPTVGEDKRFYYRAQYSAASKSINEINRLFDEAVSSNTFKDVSINEEDDHGSKSRQVVPTTRAIQCPSQLFGY